MIIIHSPFKAGLGSSAETRVLKIGTVKNRANYVEKDQCYGVFFTCNVARLPYAIATFAS